MFRRSLSFQAAKVAPAAFFTALQDNGFKAFFGVPDSLLKDICAYITANAPPERHIIAANEGNAVALASGWHLATKEVPVVYMQNSGFGNTLNPLLSLTHREVYKIPMLMLIGWRGDPGGKKDEPQHVAQGRLMEDCLKTAEVPYAVLDPANPTEALSLASAHFKEHGSPFGILIKRDSFESYKAAAAAAPPAVLPMSREEAIETILNSLHEKDVVVSTTGMPSREVFECRARAKAGHQRDFLTVGAMGHCSSIAVGIALAKPAEEGRNIIALDGDGAAVMHLGAMPVNGGFAQNNAGKLKNFKHVVVNNGAHDSVGGQPTVGFNVDLTAVAKASGYNLIEEAAVSEPAAVKAALKKLRDADGPAFLEIRVKKGNRADLGRPTTTPIANKEALMEFLQQ